MSHTRKSMKRKKGLKPLWIYDGSPDQADLTVAATTLTEGGYVIVIELANGLTRLAATRHPAKYAPPGTNSSSATACRRSPG